MIIRLAVGVATIIITLLLIALFDREASSRVPFDCLDATERERVREIVLVSIDKGLDQAIQHLYTVWQKDPDSDQPKRAQVGVVNAINAHARARRFTLAWAPCSPEIKP
jgi:hypothetical protein